MVLRFLASTLISLAVVSCGQAKPISAEFVDPITHISVRYTLRQGHTTQGEFHRDFHIRFARSEKDVPLAYDSGGYVLMSIYRMRDGSLVFFDRDDYVILDSARESVQQTDAFDQTSGALFLGCFDWYGEDHRLQFVPPSKRGDRYGLTKH